MKRKNKDLIRRLAALILCFGLLLPMPAFAADLYFTVLNDSVEYLRTDTMPVWSGGVLYVPYTVFDPGTNSTGIDLGLNVSYSRNENTVSLYALGQILTFDLNDGTCRDDVTGETYSGRAIVRNGRPYLPVKRVCDFFGMTSSYTAIPQGYLVRIKNDAVVLSDSDFIDAAGNTLSRRLREYNQSLKPTVDPKPATPSGGGEEETVSPTDVRTYLAFWCEDTAGLPAILDAMTHRGVYGLFLFTPQALERDSDLIRRILGTGHSIGILAQGENLDQTRQLLNWGNRVLEDTVHLRTTVACVPKDQRASLESEGWVCWRETMALKPTSGVGTNSFAANTLRRLNGRTAPTYLTLPGDSNTGRVLPTLLHQLDEKRFVVSIPMETRL